MCSSNLDAYYPAYGGKRARADMVHGRVGSIIDPAPETTESILVDPNSLPSVPAENEPTPADKPDSASDSSDPDADKAEDSTGPNLESPFKPGRKATPVPDTELSAPEVETESDERPPTDDATADVSRPRTSASQSTDNTVFGPALESFDMSLADFMVRPTE